VLLLLRNQNYRYRENQLVRDSRASCCGQFRHPFLILGPSSYAFHLPYCFKRNGTQSVVQSTKSCLMSRADSLHQLPILLNLSSHSHSESLLLCSIVSLILPMVEVRNGGISIYFVFYRAFEAFAVFASVRY
jgi:hypothetical protein